MNAQLDEFESSLLALLREHVADHAPAQPPPLKRRSSRLVLGGIAATIAAIGGVILVPGLGSGPAYSVQEGNSGKIEVQVDRFEDAAGLEQALAEHGITAQITYVPDGGECAPGRYLPIAGRGLGLSVGTDMFRVTLEPGAVREGETLVIDASLVRLPDSVDPETGIQSTDGFRAIISAEVTRGPVPTCTPIPSG